MTNKELDQMLTDNGIDPKTAKSKADKEKALYDANILSVEDLETYSPVDDELDEDDLLIQWAQEEKQRAEELDELTAKDSKYSNVWQDQEVLITEDIGINTVQTREDSALKGATINMLTYVGVWIKNTKKGRVEIPVKFSTNVDYMKTFKLEVGKSYPATVMRLNDEAYEDAIRRNIAKSSNPERAAKAISRWQFRPKTGAKTTMEALSDLAIKTTFQSVGKSSGNAAVNKPVAPSVEDIVQRALNGGIS